MVHSISSVERDLGLLPAVGGSQAGSCDLSPAGGSNVPQTNYSHFADPPAPVECDQDHPPPTPPTYSGNPELGPPAQVVSVSVCYVGRENQAREGEPSVTVTPKAPSCVLLSGGGAGAREPGALSPCFLPLSFCFGHH